MEVELELPKSNDKERARLYTRLNQEFCENLVAQKIYTVLEHGMYIDSIEDFPKMFNCSLEDANHSVFNILIPLGYLKRDLQGYTLAAGENNYAQEFKSVKKADEHRSRLMAHAQKLHYIAGKVMSPNAGTADISAIMTLNKELVNLYITEISKLNGKFAQKASHLSTEEKNSYFNWYSWNYF